MAARMTKGERKQTGKRRKALDGMTAKCLFCPLDFLYFENLMLIAFFEYFQNKTSNI